MSHFYGTVQGNRGEATRGGSRESGLQTYTASWSGSVYCSTYEHDGEDQAHVAFRPWRGIGQSFVLYDGPINPTDAQILAALHDAIERLEARP